MFRGRLKNLAHLKVDRQSRVIQTKPFHLWKLIKTLRQQSLWNSGAKMKYSSSVGFGNKCNSSLVPETVHRRYDFSSDLTRSFLLAAAFFSFVACPLICFLNALVILAVKAKQRLQTHSKEHYVGVHSSHRFISWCGGSTPKCNFMAIFLLQGKDFHEVCEVNLAFTISFMELSFISMCYPILISGERYLTIKYSLRHNEVLSNTRVVVSSLISWITSVILYFTLSNIILIFAILENKVFFSIVLLQILVFKQVYRHEKDILAHQVSMEVKAKFKREKKALKSTTIIIVTVLLFSLSHLLFLISRGIYSRVVSRMMSKCQLVNFVLG